MSHARTKALPKGQNDAARAFVERLVKKDFGGKRTAAAQAFKIAQATLSDFLDGNRGAGMKVLSGVAAYAKVDIEVILGVREAPSAAAERIVEYDDRYFNRRAAVLWARAHGISDAAIERVQSVSMSRHGEAIEDLSADEWYEQMRDAARDIRREEAGLAQDTERETDARERDAARAKEMESATKPKLPKRKR